MEQSTIEDIITMMERAGGTLQTLLTATLPRIDALMEKRD